MRIVTVRRISQVFFLGLFLWFCAVTILGERGWQWRGWPVNWFLQLDPLVAFGTLISTGTVYRGLLWGLATIVLTILLGRVFCGWICPFGTLHQAIGWWGRRVMPMRKRIAVNAPRGAQSIKYYVLLVFIGMALWNRIGGGGERFASSLQMGLLDPIPLLQRSVNLTVGALVDTAWRPAAAGVRAYEGAWLIGAVALAALLLNLVVPRFYCRFVCPSGALMAVLGRFAIWRIGKTAATCSDCKLCAKDCEGACEPLGTIRTAECVMCFNCVPSCRDGVVRYGTIPSAAGEMPWPSVTRRSALLALGGGLAAAPLLRLDALAGTNFRPGVLRPPGALAETDFLTRCIKCGQCMKICPTNIIQPALLQAGLEGLWTPVLNYRIGSSGCTPHCTACGHICPTAAIRPLTLDEKLGRGESAEAGPVRVGLAFVDRGRCLPWAMGTPCIVCQEVCPVTPKAIGTSVTFEAVRDGECRVVEMGEAEEGTPNIQHSTLNVQVRRGTGAGEGAGWEPGRWATGDYRFSDAAGLRRWTIVGNGRDTLDLGAGDGMPAAGAVGVIVVRLQRPVVDPARCVGCGICEHECPVSGLRAIRVTAENETRHPAHRIGKS